MKEILIVMLGGAGGALARYLVSLTFAGLRAPTWTGTLIINATGSFALGFILSFLSSRTPFPTHIQLLLTVGFLSSYTTFSTLMWESFYLGQNGLPLTAILNLGLSVSIGLVAVWLGDWVGRAL